MKLESTDLRRQLKDTARFVDVRRISGKTTRKLLLDIVTDTVEAFGPEVNTITFTILPGCTIVDDLYYRRNQILPVSLKNHC